jgi:hypothetical protein
MTRPRGSRTLLILYLGLIVLPAVQLGMSPIVAAGDKGPAAAWSDGWPEITAPERALKRVEQDPDADAVVLINQRDGKILKEADDIVNVLHYHVRMKILTERGKEYAKIEIPAWKSSRVSGVEARTIKADGTVMPLAADQIFEKVVLQVGSYRETAWAFSFPAVEPGAIVEYRYQRNTHALIYIDPFYFAGPEFTLRARMTQGIPSDMGYTLLCDLCPPGQAPQITDWREGKNKGKMYVHEVHDLPGYRYERMMPPPRDASPRLEMVLAEWKGRASWALGRQDHFFVDWASVALYASAYYQEAIKKGVGDLKPVVAGWLQGVSDPQEKVKIIYRHVQRDFRYIPFSSVYGSTRAIEDMLKEKIADNEDKAILLIAALKSIGVEALPAIVSGKNGGSLNPKYFSMSQFTHTVVAIPQPAGGYQWIDPTVSYVPFGFMPWKDSGAEALLLKGNQGEMVTLPVKNELNASRYREEARPRPDGKADVTLDAEFLGEDADDLREELVPAAESARKAWLQEWLDDRVDGAALQSYSIENLEDSDKSLRLKLTFEAPGLVTNAEDTRLVRSCILTCVQRNPISKAPRQYPFYIDDGWNEEETVVIDAPEGMQPASAGTPYKAQSPVGTFSLMCSAQGDGATRCSRQFIARRNRWGADQQAAIRTMFDRVIEADRSVVAFQAGAGEN